jgi:hypothetical protein
MSCTVDGNFRKPYFQSTTSVNRQARRTQHQAAKNGLRRQTKNKHGYCNYLTQRSLEARTGNQVVWKVGYTRVCYRHFPIYFGYLKIALVQCRGEGHLVDRLHPSPPRRIPTTHRWPLRQETVQESANAHRRTTSRQVRYPKATRMMVDE